VASAGKVFISYRREDSAGITRSIYEWLRLRLRKKDIFFDVDLEYGVDFVQKIEQTIAQCRVMLVVIGARWLGDSGAPSTYVQKEVELAFERGIKVIPVLVDGAPMPAAEQLPEKMRQLVYLNAATVRSSRDFPHDMEELGKDMGKALGIQLTPRARALTLAQPQLWIPTVSAVLLLVLSLGVLGTDVPPDNAFYVLLHPPTPAPTSSLPPTATTPAGTPTPVHVTAQTVALFGSIDNQVYAINLSDGSKRWAFPTRDQVWSSPAVVGDVAYVGSLDHNLYALNVADGTLRWTFPTRDAIKSSPVVANGVVFVGSEDHYLYAVGTDGTLLWRYQTGGKIDCSPVVSDRTIYVGSGDQSVYAIDITTGILRWQGHTGGVVDGRPLVADGTVYALSHSTGVAIGPVVGGSNSPPSVGLYAFDAATGTQKWVYQPGTDLNPRETLAMSAPDYISVVGFAPPTPVKLIYFGGVGYIYAVDMAKGTLRWKTQRPGGGSAFASPTVVNHRIYIGCTDKSLYAVKDDYGGIAWSAPAPNTTSQYAFFTTPTAVNGVIYVAADNGAFYALTDNGTSGAPRQVFKANGAIYSTPTLNG
jgi:outer membrane protein assembly factor BamB